MKYFRDWDLECHKKIWDNYKNYNHRRYCDFWLEKDGIKLMIEYDGQQHFEPVRFNGMSQKKANEIFEKQQKIHKLDCEFCKENNIILYRIKYNQNKEKLISELRRKMYKLCG